MFPKRIIYAAFAIAFAASFLLCGYEFIRAVSKSLFIEAYSAKNFPYAWVGVPPCLILFLYIYGRILSAHGATRALAITSVLSGALIFVCYLSLINNIKIAAAIIVIFREAYIVIIIEQYWSFVNSTLTEKQAKIINGPFCAIASVGSVVGGLLVGQWAESMGSEKLLIFSAVSLLPAAFLGVMAYRFAGEPKPSVAEEGGRRGHLGVKTLFSSRYLILIGVLILCTQLISTVLDLRFSLLIEEELTVTDTRTAYYGNFYAGLGAISAFLQLLIVPIALRFVSLRIVHAGIPVIHLLNGLVLTLKPSLRTGGTAFLTFKALDYSLFRAGKELFYMPLTFDERYRAKQIIDSFGYRFGKGGSSGVIALINLGLTTFSRSVKTVPGAALSITTMVASCIWCGVVSNLTLQYKKLVQANKNLDNQNPLV